MTIRVLLFATLADQVGHQQLTLTLSDKATVSDAVDRLTAEYRAVAQMREQLAMAVNMEYVTANRVLSEGDELALIPPVSGG